MADSVLMIEDDARLARMVQEYLGENGFKVTVAGTGAQGLSQIRKNGLHSNA